MVEHAPTAPPRLHGVFFNGQTSAAKKISLLENGQKFATVINAQAGAVRMGTDAQSLAKLTSRDTELASPGRYLLQVGKLRFMWVEVG